MELDTLQLGGKHHGAVAIRPVGTTTLEDALAYAHIGRKVLGEHKQRLQQANVLSGKHEVTLQDGTIIRVVTNMQGLSPIDQIYVETGNPKRKVKKKRCIGYIVQGLDVPESVAVNASYSYYFDQTSPSGTTFKRSETGGYVHTDPPTSYTDFPDNGAKYLACRVGFSSTDSPYHAVIASIRGEQSWPEGFGPFTWSAVSIPLSEWAGAGDVVETLPSINTGWSLVTSDIYASGTCTDGFNTANWEEYGGGCANTYHWSTNHPLQTPTEQVEYTAARSTIPGTYYSGTYTLTGAFPVYSCTRDSLESYTGHGTNKKVVDILGEYTQQASEMNAIGAIQYALDLSLIAPVNDFFYEGQMYITSGPPNYQLVEEGYRRTDGKGYWVGTGMHLTSYNGRGIFHLTPKGRGYGGSVFFMVPTNGETRLFRYDDTIQQEATVNNAYDGAGLYLGIELGSEPGVASGFRIQSVDSVGGACGWAELYHNPARIDRSSPDYNGVIKHLDQQVITDTFGVPITVEQGTHTVEVKAFQTGSNSVRVWLLIEDGDQYYFAKLTHPFDYVGTSSRASLRIKIGVREFEELGELVSFEQLS